MQEFFNILPNIGGVLGIFSFYFKVADKKNKRIAYNKHMKNAIQSAIDELDNPEWASSSGSYPDMLDYAPAELPLSLFGDSDPKHSEDHTLLKRKAKVKINEIHEEIIKLKRRSKELKPYYHVNVKKSLILEKESLQHLRKLFQEALAALEQRGFLESIYRKIFKS